MSKKLASLIGANAATTYFALVARIESNNNPLAKNPLSTASGLYQPIKSTWTSYGYKWADVFDVAKQHEFIDRFTYDNAQRLIANGCAINFATLYGAHFLGANGLLGIMRLKPMDVIARGTTAAQRKANPTILKGYVYDFCNWLEKKTGHNYTENILVHPVTPENVDPISIAPDEGNANMNWTNSLVFKTILQYIAQAIGGGLVAAGVVTAADAATVIGAIMVIVPALMGVFSAATEKAMVGGNVVKLAELTPATRSSLISETRK